MSGTTELDSLYSAVEETARLVDVPCSREKVWPILSAYGDGAYALAESVIAFRLATDARHAGELDCRFTIPKGVDPYARSLSKGITTETDHPVGILLSDIQGRCPIDTYAIDFGVIGGFTKIYSFFPPSDSQDLSKLAGIPSMPCGLAENIDLFARYGMGEKASCVGIDYADRTANIYFTGTSAECFERHNVLSMLSETEQPGPSEQMLKLAEAGFGVYVTLNWDSPKIERICFAAITADPMTLPIPLEPRIKKFVKRMQGAGPENKFVCAVASSPRGEYFKLQSYYQWRPWIVDLMAAEIRI
jgi:6-linalyl-2-O,3-dimethylflaviolin/7-geranyloxy-5-hydroxy-2-methoxy-3-methylnaphthalene-1,4-dione synthase